MGRCLYYTLYFGISYLEHYSLFTFIRSAVLSNYGSNNIKLSIVYLHGKSIIPGFTWSENIEVGQELNLRMTTSIRIQ